MLADHPVDVMLLATDLAVARTFYAGTRGPEAVMPSRDERRKRIPRQLALRDEPEDGAPGEPPPVRGNVPGRYEHHRWRIAPPGQSLRNLKTIDAGQLDVQEHDARMKPVYKDERRHTVFRLANDIEPFSLQQRPGRRPEARMVVHDQHRWLHRQIVARGAPFGIGATP
jgi:hypothetical protein